MVDILPTALAGGLLLSRGGFPASLRFAWLGFHRTRSYSLSTGFKYRESHGMYITSSIEIAVMDNTTFRACPDANIKR